MSKQSKRRARKIRQKEKVREMPPMSDRAIYIGLIIIGVFVTMIGGLLFEDFKWKEVGFGYLIAITYLTNFYAFLVYRGKHLANWKQALAKIPLRFVGYGTKDGKPLDAAHDHQNTKSALLLSISISIVVLVGLSFLLFPEMRGG